MTTAIDTGLEKSAGLQNIIASAAIAWFWFTERFLGNGTAWKWGFTCTMHLQGKLPCRCIWMRGLGTSVKPIGQQVTAALLIGTSSHSQRSPAARNLRLCCSHNLKFLLWWILRGRQAKTFHLLSSGNLNTMPSPPPSQPAPEASCSLGVQGAEGKRTQPRNSLNLHQKPWLP